MPRQPRQFAPGATLHVLSRGNRRQNIFESEEDWRRFRDVMFRELAAECIPLLAYCLMPNHFHTALQAEKERLARAMGKILTSHAVYMNKKYARTGHLFERRYTTIPCEPEEGLGPLIRYIHRNPVRGKLVATPDDWEWSSHRDFLDPQSSQPSGKAISLAWFDKDPAKAVQAYADFMAKAEEAAPPADEGASPLAPLCAMVEREYGHAPGTLCRHARRRDVTGARGRFIVLALEAGHQPVRIAEFLGVSRSYISKFRMEDGISELQGLSPK